MTRRHMTGHSKRTGSSRRTVGGLALTLVAIALMALAVAPAAFAKAPTKGFTVFSQCPRFTKEVTLCLYAQTKSGEVTLNKQTVPISSTITLQGGIIRNEVTEEEKFVEALNGETLTKAPQKVPGGLAGLVNCTEIKGSGLIEKAARAACELVFENGITGVNAVTELAKPASEIGINKNNLVNQEGVALTLPVKIHLENPLLGGECYIGSSSHPVVLNLSSAPPGTAGELEFKENFEIVELKGNSLVDTTFSAPEATGCGGIFAFLIDPLVNGKIGLPSGSGKNKALLTGNTLETSTENVIKSEQ